jgi:anti-sigma B factor antagonist
LRDDQRAIRLAELCSMRVERRLGTVVIWLTGEFDDSCEERFHEELGGALDNETEMLVMDLRGLEFIDSTGLRVLVHLNNVAKQDDFDFAVLCGDGRVREVLRETGLDGVLPLLDAWGTVPASDSPV